MSDQTEKESSGIRLVWSHGEQTEGSSPSETGRRIDDEEEALGSVEDYLEEPPEAEVVNLGNIRASRTGDATVWGPRDVLATASAELPEEYDTLIVMALSTTEEGSAHRYWLCGQSIPETLGLIDLVKNTMLSKVH